MSKPTSSASDARMPHSAQRGVTNRHASRSAAGTALQQAAAPLHVFVQFGFECAGVRFFDAHGAGRAAGRAQKQCNFLWMLFGSQLHLNKTYHALKGFFPRLAI
eukprot:23692-Chlamydomonas_euryale.AAC.2